MGAEKLDSLKTKVGAEGLFQFQEHRNWILSLDFLELKKPATLPSKISFSRTHSFSLDHFLSFLLGRDYLFAR